MDADLKCPLCGQEINEQQYAYTKKKLTQEASLENQNQIKILNDTVYEKERHLQDVQFEHSQQLERVLDNHTEKINNLMSSNEEMVDNLRTQIKEDHLQHMRLTEDFNNIQDKLNKKQSELIGEVGEIELLETLKEYFPDDDFTSQTRGTSEADIVQTIHYNHQPLDIRICYDNKQKTSVTKIHVDKAKIYQQIHNTKHVLIVSSILPKTDIPNSLVGTKDGILLVHPKIIGEVVKLLRENLISIHTKISTEMNRDTKETELYNFVTSHQFAMQLSVVSNCYHKLDKLLTTEMTSHTRSWKQRKKILDELLHAKINIEQEINVITDEDLKEIETPDDLTVEPESF